MRYKGFYRMDILISVALVLVSFAAFGAWRVQDGWDNKVLSNGVGIALPIVISALVLLQNGFARTELIIIAPMALTSWMMIKGMPGWERYLPFTNSDGEEKQGMIIGFAVFPWVMGVVMSIILENPLWLPWAASGLLVSIVYVEGSKAEDKGITLPVGTAAEFWGPLSYGFLGAGLAAFSF